jgi:hypothetical protein
MRMSVSYSGLGQVRPSGAGPPTSVPTPSGLAIVIVGADRNPGVAAQMDPISGERGRGRWTNWFRRGQLHMVMKVLVEDERRLQLAETASAFAGIYWPQ